MDAPEIDRTATKAKPRHKGIRIQVWMPQTALVRLDAIAEFGGITRSDAVRRMIDSQPIPDKTCRQAVAALGRVGGLIKLHKAATPAEIGEIWDAIKDIRRAIYGR